MKASVLGRVGSAGIALLAVAFSWSSPAAAAGHANNLGDKSQLIITADRLIPVFGYTYSSVTTTQNGQELTDSRTGAGMSLLFGRDFGLAEDTVPINVHTLPRLAFDFTIIPHLTLGAAIAFGFGLGGTDKNEFLQGNARTTRSVDAPRATAIGIAPRVGYVIPLGDVLAFWPRAGFGFYSVSAKRDSVDQNNPNNVTTRSATDTVFSLDLDPQLAIVPLEHFFFHVGPLVNIPLSGSRSVKTTSGATTVSVSTDTSLFHFGITAGLGGWFNL
jgi:hypothetical protein